MIYVIGVIGFIGGFVIGQMVLYFLLRHKTKAELLNDPTLKLYGFINWVFAIAGCYALIESYKFYFPT